MKTSSPGSLQYVAADDHFSALLDAAVDAIILINEDGNIVRFSRSAEKLFGYISSEVVGKNVNCLMPEPYRTEHDGYLQLYRSTAERRIIGIGREVIARRKDGSAFPIDLSVGEFRHENEHGYVGIVRDISERKKHERQLLAISEELRLIFDNAPTAMLITDATGHIANANRASRKLLGYTLEEFQHRRFSDLAHPEDRDGAIKDLQKLRSVGDTLSNELRLLRKDGAILQALHYSAVAMETSSTPLIIAEIVDRTELLQATREAEDLRMRLTHVARLGTLGEMVSGIAHEVNQPLTAIANYASACRRMLNSGKVQPEDLVGTLQKISDQAERAGQVIRGLRALLRKRDPVRDPLDCNQLVREVSSLTEFELRQSGFRMILTLQTRLPKVIGDGVQIQQVIINLIRNAMEAMRERCHNDFIEVGTLSDLGWVEVRVADNGPGLDPAITERLFEPFFTTKTQGIGLGLSICQSILTAHGGEIKFERNQWGGTTFRIRLPEQGQAA
jgi:two-component system sensor kinase FixL